jgi:hypothetical protein
MTKLERLDDLLRQDPQPAKVEILKHLDGDLVIEPQLFLREKAGRCYQAPERLGSSVTHKADVRVIAASNRDLSAVFPVEIPPLRARKDDIPLLVWYFLDQLGAGLGKKIERVPTSTMDRLVAYDWPGNVRELRNVLEAGRHPLARIRAAPGRVRRRPGHRGRGERPPGGRPDASGRGAGSHHSGPRIR